MNYLEKVIVLGVLISASGRTYPQDVKEAPNPSSDEIRVSYFKSAMLPDGVAFALSAQTLTTLADDDLEFATSWMLQEFGLNETDALHMLAILTSAVESIEADKQDKYKEIACIDGAPRVQGEKAYTALEQMDDAADAIAEVHYRRVKNQVEQITAERLQAWLEKQKLSIVHAKFDQKERSNRIGVDGDNRLEKICSLFNQKSDGGN